MLELVTGLGPTQSASLSAVAASVSAIAALAIMSFTVLLWIENRRLRQAGHSPQVVAHLFPHPDGHGGINFILTNVGSGPAFNVKFQLSAEADDLAGHEVMIANDPERSPIGVIPQGGQISALFGISYVLYGGSKSKPGPLKPFFVSVLYEDSLGRKRSSRSQIDIKQFAGLRGILSKPPIASAADSLKEISKHLAKISSQTSRFNAFVDVSKIDDTSRRIAKGST